MTSNSDNLLLITGATGLVGSHVAEEAHRRGIPTRVLVRDGSDTALLDQWGVEKITGDLTDVESVKRAVTGASTIVHCAAKVGDWGPVEDYRKVNVGGLQNLLQAVASNGTVNRFVHVSSLGVYQARDHHGTDETEPPSLTAIDGYTRTKAEAELALIEHVRDHGLPAVTLRPGFIYGPRDRTVFPKLLQKLKSGEFAFLGSSDKLMNNTYVGNLIEAIFIAIGHEAAVGQAYNITDGELVSKHRFMTTITRLAGYDEPTKTVPIGVARGLTRVLETTWKLLGKQEAPILSQARIKMLGLNLDFSTEKAKRELDYKAPVEFDVAMRQTLDWCREANML